MLNVTLSCPIWQGDDITKCFRDRYFEFGVPVILGAISLIVLVVSTILQSQKKKTGRLELNGDEEPLLAQHGGYDSISNYKLGGNQESIKQRHFAITRLSDTNEDGTVHGEIVDVLKGVMDRIRVTLEYLLVAMQVVISTSFFFVGIFQHEWETAPYVPISKAAFWWYLFVLNTIRLVSTKNSKIKLPGLWNHATTLYFFNSIPTIVNFRSVIIKSMENEVVRNYYLIDFLISISLLIINFSSKRGDGPATIYVTSDGATPSPERVTSIFSFSTYMWIDKLIWTAYRSTISMKDVWSLREDDYALQILKAFEAGKSTKNFTIKLFTHFKWLLAAQIFWAALEAHIVFVPSYLLKKLLEHVEDPTVSSRNMAWTFVLLMPVFKLFDSVSSGFSLFIGRRICLRMKAIIIGEVYAKGLRRKITVREETEKTEENDKDKANDSKGKKKNSDKDSDKKTNSTAELGAIINLMAVDSFKVSEICGYLHYFVGALLMIVICITFLFNLLGPSALVGAVAIIALLPLNYKIARWTSLLQKKMLAITDKRIQSLNEALQSIRIIKFFAWEDNFYNSIMKIRRDELHELKMRTLAWSVGSFVWFITPTLITLLSFYCYTIIEGRTLTAPIAFTSLSLFTLLRSPLDQLSDMTSFLISSKVSLDRIGEFLDEKETTKYEQLGQDPGPNSPNIGFEDATFSWNSESESDFKLRDLNIEFKPGKLNVIIGQTGAGKSSLLLALLGEMDLLQGKVFLPGIVPRAELEIDSETGLSESVAYCTQSAWLLNDTIRNNITFVSPFNKERYEKVIDACGLTRDLAILSAGDSTEIGEKGIALSGGQKQRVSLARALYSNSRHILLDDCLSAVDSHTALWIYENCITGPLMEGRTCILVTHNIALTVQKAEWIVIMDNGRVKTQGTPGKLLASGDLGDDDLVKSSVMNSRSQSSVNLKSLADKNSEMKAKAATIDAKLKAIAAPEEEMVKTDGKLVDEETKSDGVVSISVYKQYAKTMGGFPTWALILTAFAASQGIYIFQSWWLKNWSLHSNNASSTTFTMSKLAMAGIGNAHDSSGLKLIAHFFSHSTNFISASIGLSPAHKKEDSTLYYITIYGIIGITYSVFAVCRVYITFYSGIRASNRIFKRLLNTIFRARLRFFDKTPVGRIMNRFSKDIESVDQELTPYAEGAFICIVLSLSTLLLISVITPGFLIFALLISLLYNYVGMLYVSLSRELKRLESITRSPIHQHFTESLTGVSTIRAYGVESRFMKENLAKIDYHNRPFFYLWVDNRWLSLRCDLVGSLVMLFAGAFILISIGKIDAGLAGLSLSYAIGFSESALWVVRLYAVVEMNMNSVERLQEYYDIEQEPPQRIPETEPRPTWPEKGEISVKDVSLRYSPELPRVIKNVSFEVEGNNKVGIVGRTGAGKSTIITAFFRFLDPETGSILIDGIDITKIGLYNLRQAITIIPQDPTLFTGTIRSNLDPFEQYSDEAIFESLRRVNLISPEDLRAASPESTDQLENRNKFLKLDTAITEGGNNLSQGQRQLMCLARSLLKSPKVILLDEATASIDYKSDALIQNTIREEFSNSTILTIAHRLRSIIDYDKILVMDNGQVVEYDDPYTLISDKSSLFYSMCENSGELDSLIKLATEAHQQQQTGN